MEEKSVFEEVEEVEEVEETSEDMEEESSGYEEWNPTVSKESPKDKLERKGLKENADGRILTIEKTFFTRPKTTDPQGNKIDPKKTLDGNTEFYSGKLGIRFVEDNLVEYYPNFKYFVNEDGKINTVAKINRSGKNEVTQIFKLAVAKIGKPEEEVSDQDFYDFLIGQKVEVKTTTGTYNKKDWFRNDIVKFVE